MRRPGCSAGPRTVRASPQIVVRAVKGPNHAINLWLTEFGGATAIGLRPVAPPSSPHLQVLEATWTFGESSAGREPSRRSGYGGGGNLAPKLRPAPIPLVVSRNSAAIVRATRRRDGRVAEGARLESVYTGNRIVGSNPTPSATDNAVVFSCRPVGPRETAWGLDFDQALDSRDAHQAGALRCHVLRGSVL